jgi:hypothetical protein
MPTTTALPEASGQESAQLATMFRTKTLAPHAHKASTAGLMLLMVMTVKRVIAITLRVISAEVELSLQDHSLTVLLSSKLDLTSSTLTTVQLLVVTSLIRLLMASPLPVLLVLGNQVFSASSVSIVTKADIAPTLV